MYKYLKVASQLLGCPVAQNDHNLSEGVIRFINIKDSEKTLPAAGTLKLFQPQFQQKRLKSLCVVGAETC